MDLDISEANFNAAVLPTTIEAGTNLTTNVAALYPNTTPLTGTGLTEFDVPPAVTGVIGEDYLIGALTVRVWVEGWDQEAFNSILSGTLSVSFSFTGI